MSTLHSRDEERRAIILAPNVSFASWREDLKSALSQHKVIGHVFYDIEYIPAERLPARKGDETDAALAKRRATWKNEEFTAKGIIIRRIESAKQPVNHEALTAHELYQSIEQTHKPTLITPYSEAFKKFFNTKFTLTADDYCSTFERNLQTLRQSAENMSPPLEDSSYSKLMASEDVYMIPRGAIKQVFVDGTRHVDWLDTWRQTSTVASNGDQKYVPLENMMSSIRATAEGRRSNSRFERAYAATGSAAGGDDDICRQCTHHRHTNARCFVQHPELHNRPGKHESRRGKAGGRKNAKARAAGAVNRTVNNNDSSDEFWAAAALPTEAFAAAATAEEPVITRDSLLYDTGTTKHLINDKRLFSNLHCLKEPFNFEQAATSGTLTHGGTAHIKLGSAKVRLDDAMYSPKSSCNLISAVRLMRIGKVFPDFDNNTLVRHKGNRRLVVAKLQRAHDVIVILPIEKVPTTKIVAPAVARLPKTTDTQRIHERLGHAGRHVLIQTKAQENVLGLDVINSALELPLCQTCHVSKAQRLVCHHPRPLPSKALNAVFIDVMGPHAPSYYGHRWATVITDGKTRMRWIFFTKGKDEIGQQVVIWLRRIQNLYDRRIKTIFSDNGNEIRNHTTTIESQLTGIRMDDSAPYTPEQNGIAEAANKVVLLHGRCFRVGAAMPLCFWDLAAQHACWISNRLFNTKTKKIPLLDFEEDVGNDVPTIDYSKIPVFGTKAFYKINPKPSHKYEARASIGWFVGFQQNQMTNKLILAPHRTATGQEFWRVIVTPHVSHDENVTMGAEMEAEFMKRNVQRNDIGGISTLDIHPTSIVEGELISSTNNVPRVVPSQGPNTQASGPVETHATGPEFISSEQPHSPTRSVQGESPANETQSPESGEQTHNTDQLPEGDQRHNTPQSPEGDQQPSAEQSPEGDQRPSTTQSSLDDERGNAEQSANHDQGHSTSPHIDQAPIAEHSPEQEDEQPDFPMQPFFPPSYAGKKRERSIDYTQYVSSRGRTVERPDYKRLHLGKAAVNTTNKHADPVTYAEAMTVKDAHNWKAAIAAEMKSLRDTGTIKIINERDMPKGRHLLTGKWIFKKKALADGSLDKYKARWTARGFTQQHGTDYFETFAPTPRAETTRILLALSHQLKWQRYQGDIPVAFLNPQLDVTLYMRMPEGFDQKGKVVKVMKGLYGLKQSAALWHCNMKETLSNLGFNSTESDSCLFTNKAKDVFVVLHVDDLLVTGPNTGQINRLRQALFKKYKLKDVTGDLFLGVRISTKDKHLVLDQGHFARQLLKRFQMDNCKPSNYPMERMLLPNPETTSPAIKEEYNQVVGGLQWLANHTRPDICHAVNHLARFLANPSKDHLKAARRVLSYIAKDPDAGIKYGPSKPTLEAFSDADFGGETDSMRSTTGTVVTMNGPIHWKSHLQRDVVLSSTEAEYLALTETCRTVAWIRNLFEELGLQDRVANSNCPTIHVDNQSAIALVKNHSNHTRNKHIALRNHYCRQQYDRGYIAIRYVPTKEQRADALTKPRSPVPIH